MNELPEEIKEALFIMSRRERSELVLEIIDKGLCDIDTAISILGFQYSSIWEVVVEELSHEHFLANILLEIPTSEISDYVNNKMQELI